MEPVCRRCPRVLSASCCEVEEQERLATLTLADVERAQAATALAPAAFCVEEWWEGAEALEYETRRPLYRGYFRHGPRRLTLARREGACVFLAKGPSGGCRLDVSARPTACLLYPFELWPDGSWSLQVERYGALEAARAAHDACLAVEEAHGMDDVLAAFGTTREEVEALGARLRAEVSDHARRTAPGFFQVGRGARRRRRPPPV